MPAQPRVSIIIPVHDDEDWIAAALDSCLAQTESSVEIICVDDASNDATCTIVERYRRGDPRIRLIRQPTNRSAFQARRVGVFAASADRLLFLDGDDELAPTAVEESLATALRGDADVVGFGVEVVVPPGVSAGRFAREIQPRHAELTGAQIVPGIFPPGETAQGHLWRYLWDVELLREAYGTLPVSLELYRANDIPITFLALALARKYVSLSSELYRYYWRRGVSGQLVTGVTDFAFYVGALDSIDAISKSIESIVASRSHAAGLVESYRSSRLSIIQTILRYCLPIANPDVRDECYASLVQRAGAMDVILAAAIFFNDSLPLVARHADRAPESIARPRSVVITTNDLSAGGLQSVVASQARFLSDAGMSVTIAARRVDEPSLEVPAGVEIVEMAGRSSGEKLASLVGIMRARAADVVLNHWLLYDEVWPFAALAARALGIRMIGWIHNFALRPTYDFNTRGSLLATYLPLLERAVVLSPTDVAFWKLRGVENAVYLPNPPSPLLRDHPRRRSSRSLTGVSVRLVWWGRLQHHTKRIRDLLDVAVALRARSVDFQLTIIGPDSADTSADDLRADARDKGIDGVIEFRGPLQGQELMDELEASDIYVSTSAIEGYPLTLVEAQALGLPVAMYELPWLALVDQNDGIVSVEQGDSYALAAAIGTLVTDGAEYARRSKASLCAADEALSYDFARLYQDLLAGELTDEWAPEPTLADARLLLNLSIEFEEMVVERERKHGIQLAEQRNAARREAMLLRIENAKLNEPNVVTGIRPLGRALLKLVPGLRPTARRFNRWVRGL